MNKHVLMVAVVVILFAGSAIMAQDYGGYGTMNKPMAATIGARDIMAVALVDTTLALFVKHANKAGLAQTLQGAGPFTVFAADNNGFNARAQEDIDQEHKDNAVLVSTMKYHVITGKALTTADLLKMNGQTLKMDNGMQLHVAVTAGSIIIGNARIIRTDITASNGVIHVIDRVEIPGKVMAPMSPAAPMGK